MESQTVHMNYNSLLTAAIMAYDRGESKKPYYNRYAMPQLLKRVTDVVADIERGADVRMAILAGFNGRVLDKALKAVGLPRATPEEKLGSGVYRPVTTPSE